MLPNTFYMQSRYKIHQKSYKKMSSKKDNFHVFLKYYKSAQNIFSISTRKKVYELNSSALPDA